MNKEQEEWFRNLWSEFKDELEGQPPNEPDWQGFTRLRALEQDSPLSNLSSSERFEFARLMYRNFEIQDVESSDVSTKARDAEANLNNRRYVDGSF